MSARYKRILHYTTGKDSDYFENAESLSEALDRELKFVESQNKNRNPQQRRVIAWIRIHEAEKPK